jgi:hypothetical protein
MNTVRSLEEILHRCAVLRCVATLQHRREYGDDAKI